MTTATTNPRPDFATVVRAGAIALAIATVVNTLLFLIANAAGAIDATVIAPTGGPIGLSNVLILSVAPPIVATLLFALLARFTPRPGAIFVAIAALVFVGFLFGPFSLGGPVAMVVVLQLMHVVVAVPVVVLLLRTLR